MSLPAQIQYKPTGSLFMIGKALKCCNDFAIALYSHFYASESANHIFTPFPCNSIAREGSHPQGGTYSHERLTDLRQPRVRAVRTVELDSQPWLVGKDVAEALGYKNPARPSSPTSMRMTSGLRCCRRGQIPKWECVPLIQDSPHQRVRPLQPDPEQQDAEGQSLQALGHKRGSARPAQERRV